MIDLETTVEITRPVDEVFAFVADQTNAPQWQNGLREVRRLTEGPIGAGSQYEFVRRFAGREIATRNRFVAFEEGEPVRFEIPEGWLTGQADLDETQPERHRPHQPNAVPSPRFRSLCGTPAPPDSRP